MRRVRLVFRVFLVLLVLAGLAVFALRWFLATPSGSAWVAGQLQTIYGGRVGIDRVDVGFGSSTVHGLRLFEADGETPWAAVSDVHVGVPAWRLLDTDLVQQHLVLTGAAITLRFDERGRLLTRIPPQHGAGSAPVAVSIQGGQVILQQAGKPDFVVRNVQARLHSEGDNLVLGGTMSHPEWGDWSAGGMLGRQTGSAALTIQTAQTRVTPERLALLPFVPADVGEQVEASGKTPAEIVLRYDPDTDRLSYRVTLEPADASIRIDAIDLRAEQVKGRIVVEDGRIQLRDLKGASADGRLQVRGDLDFVREPAELRFTVGGDRLDLRQLPRAWDLPELFEGRLSGQADLRILLENGLVRTDGLGRGVVREARIAGKPTTEPVQLRLVADQGRFKFVAPVDPPSRPPQPASGFNPAGWVAAGLLGAGGMVIDAGVGIFARLHGKSDPSGPGSYLQASLSLQDIELAPLLRTLKIELPVPVDGRLSFDVRLGIPVDSLRELKNYRLEGTVRIDWLRAADLEVPQIEAKLDYRNGILDLLELRGKATSAGGPPGTLAGSARIELVPFGKLSAQLDLQEVSGERVLSLLPGGAQLLQGRFTGQTLTQVPLARMGEIQAWESTAELAAEKLLIQGHSVTQATGQVKLLQGRVIFTGLRGVLEGSPAAAAAWLGLSRSFPFAVSFRLQPGDPQSWQRLLGEAAIEGGIEVDGTVRGTLQPFSWNGSGTAGAAALTVRRIPLSRVKLRWEGDDDRLRLGDITAALGRGELTGSATVPLRGQTPGPVHFLFQDVDVDVLAREFLGRPGIDGRCSGSLQGSIGAFAAGSKAEVSLRAEFRVPRLRFQLVTADRLHGFLTMAPDAVDYRCDGEFLGGRVHLQGRHALDAAGPPGAGKLIVAGAQLGRIWESLPNPESLRPLQGVVDFEVGFRQENGNAGLTGTGRLWLQQVRWNGIELADRLQADLGVDGAMVRIRNLTGTFCQGFALAQIGLNLSEPERRWFHLTIERAEAERLLAPWPALAAHITGTTDVRLQGTLGREWQGSGTVAINRGRLWGVEVVDCRLPVDFAHLPGEGSGHLDIREAHAQAARGRAVGQVALGWGGATRLDLKLRFFGVDLQVLAPQTADLNRLNRGKLSGRLELAGHDVRSLDDLNGILDASLEQTQILDLPVFRQLAPYVAPRQPQNVPFQSGDVKAQLAHGVIHVERLRLYGRITQLLIQGTMTTRGRVDLQVTTSSSLAGFESRVLAPLGLDLGRSGPPGTSVLGRAGAYLSSRLVQLKVTGMVHNPNVQIVPLPVLTDEAARFFIGGPVGR